MSIIPQADMLKVAATGFSQSFLLWILLSSLSGHKYRPAPLYPWAYSIWLAWLESDEWKVLSALKKQQERKAATSKQRAV